MKEITAIFDIRADDEFVEVEVTIDADDKITLDVMGDKPLSEHVSAILESEHSITFPVGDDPKAITDEHILALARRSPAQLQMVLLSLREFLMRGNSGYDDIEVTGNFDFLNLGGINKSAYPNPMSPTEMVSVGTSPSDVELLYEIETNGANMSDVKWQQWRVEIQRLVTAGLVERLETQGMGAGGNTRTLSLTPKGRLKMLTGRMQSLNVNK